MDLSSLVVLNREVELEIPGIGETGFFISIRHDSAPEVQKFQASYRAKSADEARKGKKGKSNELLEYFLVENTIAHIGGWRWTNPEFNIGGDQPQFSKEKAAEIIRSGSALAYYIKQLVARETDDEESFLAKSA